MGNPPTFKRYPALPGNPVSVTAVLRAVWPKPQLERWKRSQVVMLGREYPELSSGQILARFDRDKGAASRGQMVHKAIEALIQWEPVPDLSTEAQAYFERFSAWWRLAGLIPMATEHVVAGDGYAGTLDLLAQDGPDNERSPVAVVDWKTTGTLPKAYYGDHGAQLAAYAKAIESTVKVDYGIVVYIAPDGCRAFPLDDTQWSKAHAQWDACWDFFKALYPEAVGS